MNLRLASPDPTGVKIDYVRSILSPLCFTQPNARYTPPTLTQLNCRVELRRRCVLNLQLVGDSLDESEQFTDNEVELRRVGGVNPPVVSRDPVSNFLRQSRVESSRRRVGVGGVY